VKLRSFLSTIQKFYYAVGRVSIYLLAAAFAGDWKTVIGRTLGIRSFYRKATAAGVTHYLAYYLDKELEGCNSVLDLGCGASCWLQTGSSRYSVGVDVFEPDLQESKRKGLHTHYILGDVRKIEFKDGSFDGVLASEVIEHLTKEEGYELVKNMTRWARKKVIISTPNGEVHGSQIMIDFNPHQRHMSGWNIDEFKRLGFKVHGARGWWALRDPEGERIKFKPEFFWQTVSGFTALVLYRFPRHSLALFCVKTLG
jgi:SAM-dependent methyltransferase